VVNNLAVLLLSLLNLLVKYLWLALILPSFYSYIIHLTMQIGLNLLGLHKTYSASVSVSLCCGLINKPDRCSTWRMRLRLLTADKSERTRV